MEPIVIDSSVLIDAVVYVRPKVLELIQNNLVDVLDLTLQIFNESYLFSKKYGLFPNDALIAATCKHNGIKKIATFDPDFDSVDFLEVITL